MEVTTGCRVPLSTPRLLPGYISLCTEVAVARSGGMTSGGDGQWCRRRRGIGVEGGEREDKDGVDA